MGRSRLKKLFLGCTVALLLLFMLEGLVSCAGAIRAAARVQGLREEGHCEYDADLGWRHIKNIRKTDFYEKGAGFTTNSQGLRGTADDYETKVPEGRYRIVFLGDSFTMGFGVDDRKTFPAQVEALCPTIQSINMGNGGYGIGQDYLWYRRDGVEFETDLLVFSVIDDDFRRLLLDAFTGYPKPRLRLDEDEIVVDNVPVKDGYGSRTTKMRVAVFLKSLALGRAMARLVAPSPAAPPEVADFDPVARMVFRELKDLSRERGQGFALVYLPSSPVVKSDLPIADWLRRTATEESIPFLDLTDDFNTLEPAARQAYYRPDTHFTAAGNAFVAERLLEGLREFFPDLPRD